MANSADRTGPKKPKAAVPNDTADEGALLEEPTLQPDPRPQSAARRAPERTIADGGERTVAQVPEERTVSQARAEPEVERTVATASEHTVATGAEHTVATGGDRTVADAGMPPAGSVAPDPVEGDVIGGRYRLVESLGKGGAGAVFRSERIEDGEIVAIKVLAAAKVKRARVVQRFFDEVRAASLVQHPGLIKILDFVEEEEPRRLAYAMEYVEGEALRDRIKRESALDLRLAISIATQIADALSALHDAGIIHRDLKPENILLLGPASNPTPKVKLLDFGVVKFLPVDRSSGQKETEKPGTFVGTPRYMAPEQAAGTSVDARADLFALGVVLFEMITGRCPHEGDSLRDVVLAKLKGAPRITVNADKEILPAELTEVVDGCLQLKPALRPESAKKVAAVLRDADLVLFAVGPVKARDNESRARAQPERPPTTPGLRGGPVSETHRHTGDLPAPAVATGSAAKMLQPAEGSGSSPVPQVDDGRRIPVVVLIAGLVLLLSMLVLLLWNVMAPSEPALLVPVDPPVTPLRTMLDASVHVPTSTAS